MKPAWKHVASRAGPLFPSAVYPDSPLPPIVSPSVIFAFTVPLEMVIRGPIFFTLSSLLLLVHCMPVPLLPLPISIQLFPCLAFYSALKKEAAGSSEMLVMIYHTVWYHIPEDSGLPNCHSNCTSLKEHLQSYLPASCSVFFVKLILKIWLFLLYVLSLIIRKSIYLRH
jgi:hypothetical protein